MSSPMLPPTSPVVDATAEVWAARNNAARKGVRTALQVFIAACPMLLLALSGALSPAAAASLTAALAPLVTVAQNVLEDRGIIGTWLRRPTLSGTESVVLTIPPPGA